MIYQVASEVLKEKKGGRGRGASEVLEEKKVRGRGPSVTDHVVSSIRGLKMKAVRGRGTKEDEVAAKTAKVTY